MATLEPATGQQHLIRAGDQEAVVVELGGGLRTYEVAGVPVLAGYPADEIPDGARGMPLVPWPNRVKDGRYRWEGLDLQLDLSEPEQHNAIHGLARWLSWQPRASAEDRVVLGVVIQPQPGYPWRLDVEIAYELSDEGLTVTTWGRNLSGTAAPYALGFHPYLHPGGERVDDARLTLPAATRIVTGDQQIPTGREPVAGTAYDFRDSGVIGRLAVDYAFGELARDAHGRAWLELARADGLTTRVWVDEAYPYYEIFTADGLSPARASLGVEPMTAPPNALATGEDVVRLAPGAEHVARWGVTLAAAPPGADQPA